VTATRWPVGLPALVSFLFGLVHGLGFAGALKNVGLPQSHLPLALLCFNVGVELGQLLTVLAAFALTRIPMPRRWMQSARRPALYAIGVLAAYWSWQRIAAIIS
jgi:HupE / UreJ protein